MGKQNKTKVILNESSAEELILATNKTSFPRRASQKNYKDKHHKF
jgi:hypothetical protein